MRIRGLGYVGIGAREPAALMDFATRILGLMPARSAPGEEGSASHAAADGSVYLKMDAWQWRLAIHPCESGGRLLYMGFELGSEIELEEACAELVAAGVPVRPGTAAEAAARAVTAIAFTRDPAGNALELFYAPRLDRDFVSPQGMRFLTGDMGLGHVNLTVAQLRANQDFYVRVLGFRLTDYYRFGDGLSANFYHCNPRHHTIGLAHVGPFDGIHHLMLEVAEIDDVGKCMERVEAAGIPISSTLGRHSNDHILSFYMRSPFGFDVEIGCGAIRVDENWTPRLCAPGDIWGHKGLTAENMASDAKSAAAAG